MRTRTTPVDWQAVFFDFDGVIADSTHIKGRAFAALFAPYGPQVQAQVERYHLDNGGMPRMEKVRHCHEVFVGHAIDDAELTRQLQCFADMVRDEVMAAPFIPGALETLQLLQRKNIPCFVVSGTPHAEMNAIVQQRGLQQYFVEVHGSPLTKAEIVADILGRRSLLPRYCLFIGDALADYRAAQATDLHFLGIVPEGTSSIFSDGTTISSRVRLP